MNLEEKIDNINTMVEKHNALLARIDEVDANLNIITDVTVSDCGSTTIKLPDTKYWMVDTHASHCNDPIFIHKTNCPNCGGLLDGDEHIPYVRCGCCGAKVWSEREVS